MRFRRPGLAHFSPEQRRAARVTVRRWVLVLFAVLGGLGWGWGVWQSHEANTASQTAASESSTTHALAQELIRKDNEIQRILRTHSDEIAEVAALEKQVATVIDGLPAADKYLGALAAGLENQLQSICNALHASCSNLPVSLPSASSSSTATTATTTTAPHAAPAASPARTTTTTRPHRGRGRTR